MLDINGANSMIMITEHLNATLTKIESLVVSNSYSGNMDDMFDVIETFLLYRPVRYFIYL